MLMGRRKILFYFPRIMWERECCLLVLNLVSSTLSCIRQPSSMSRLTLPHPLHVLKFIWKGISSSMTGTILSVLVAQLVDRLGGDGFWNGDYGWGSGYAAIFSIQYSVIWFWRTRDDFCTVWNSARWPWRELVSFVFQLIKHSTHTSSP